MTKSARHLINAVICGLVLAHAIYWFVSGRMETATELRIGLVVAQAILGFVGVIWFWSRSRGAAN
jgi:high-affinity Fe2+/Pb2+ permease